MSHVHILGVECPDCGQVFVDADQNLKRDEDYPKEDLGTFKKPTIISRVVNRIFSPFSAPASRSSPGGAPPPAHSTVSSRQQIQMYQNSSYTPSRIGSEVKCYKRKRGLGEGSENGSRATWFPGGSASSTYSLKRGRLAGIDSSYRPRPPTSSSYHPFLRTPLGQVYSNLSNFQSNLGPGYDDDGVSENFDSDRLNLKKYVQPQISTTFAVRGWLNEHTDCDPIDSLLTPDLSCDCKNGKNAEREKILSNILQETADSVLRIQKALEEVTGSGPHGNNVDKKHGGNVLVAIDRLNAVIGESSQMRLRLLGLFDNGSSS